MARDIPVVRGISGLALGELFILGDAADVLMGRSRSCGISFQRFRPWLALSEVEQRLRDHFNSAVSRKHLHIVTRGSLLTLENLSSTGTSVNGAFLEKSHDYDLSRGPLIVVLGMAPEQFVIELMNEDEANRYLATLPAVAEPTRQPGVPDPVEAPTPLNNRVLPP